MRAPVDGDLLGVEPIKRMPSRSLIETPSMNSMASTRDVDSSGKVSGMWTERIVGELEPTALDGAALAREIELSLDRALEFAGQSERPVDGEVRQSALDELGEVLDDVEIGLHDLGDFRPLHFQGDDPAIAQDRPVHL